MGRGLFHVSTETFCLSELLYGTKRVTVTFRASDELPFARCPCKRRTAEPQNRRETLSAELGREHIVNPNPGFVCCGAELETEHGQRPARGPESVPEVAGQPQAP